MDMLCNRIMLHGDVSVLNRGNANGSRTQCVMLVTVTVTAQRGGNNTMLSSSHSTKQRKRSHFVCGLTVSILIFQFVKIYLLHSWHFSYQASLDTHAVRGVLMFFQ
jgi:hypothetical protein